MRWNFTPMQFVTYWPLYFYPSLYHPPHPCSFPLPVSVSRGTLTQDRYSHFPFSLPSVFFGTPGLSSYGKTLTITATVIIASCTIVQCFLEFIRVKFVSLGSILTDANRVCCWCCMPSSLEGVTFSSGSMTRFVDRNSIGWLYQWRMNFISFVLHQMIIT